MVNNRGSLVGDPLLLINMVDDKEIIYIALRNQAELYLEALEDTENPLEGEERDLAEYILSRTAQLINQYEKEMNVTESDLVISRPKWD